MLKGVYNVGYRVLEFTTTETIQVAVWYPTNIKPREYRYGMQGFKGCAAEGAPISAAQKKYPLLIVSHGFGGGGISQVYLCEFAASHGWIVAAPDYQDKHNWVRIKGGEKKSLEEIRKEFQDALDLIWEPRKEQFEYRLATLKLIVDRFLGDREWKKLIDHEKIALCGHSLGGFTSLAVSGPWDKYTDERIKAIVIMSGGVRMFDPDDFKKLKIPSMYMYGEKESTDQRKGLRIPLSKRDSYDIAFRNSASPSYLIEIKDATHFAFNNSRDESGEWGGTKEQFDLIKSYSVAFLNRYVLGRKDFDGFLMNKHPMLSRYEHKL
ncbi:MAG: hypothetical protein HY606_10770 [Planctomycetes bacterium]|nr:hypothetical protein [Planctomycetota bacterium]